MLIYIADDELLLLEDLRDAVTESIPTAKIKAFEWAGPLIDELKEKNDKPDIAFLDIEMPGMSGINLARELKKVSPNTKLIFVTGFAQYAVEAFSIHADGYLMKPVTSEKISAELDHLCPMLIVPKRVRIMCFGNFEVYLDGEPVHFSYAKSKEMLAYLVDRKGSLCTNNEIMAALWEDDVKESYFQNVRRSLIDALPAEILKRQKGKIGIAEDQVDCDYYDFLNGKCTVFLSQYMSQYSWSEITLGELVSEKQHIQNRV